jgi:hypothetical protein
MPAPPIDGEVDDDDVPVASILTTEGVTVFTTSWGVIELSFEFELEPALLSVGLALLATEFEPELWPVLGAVEPPLEVDRDELTGGDVGNNDCPGIGCAAPQPARRTPTATKGSATAAFTIDKPPRGIDAGTNPPHSS